jgi:3-hydroxyacyl-CoA dehydrogenase
MDVKKSIFENLDKVCKQGAILASNTSALDLNEIAEATSRPEDVIGLHFFSPANIMRLLEIVRGAKTAKDVLATALNIGKKIRKVSVVSGVCHGFIGNRILFPRQIQAEAMLSEGALPWQVDKASLDFGFPMGPFGMADLAGVDLGWVKEESSSSTPREIMNENGRHGRKTNAGFYDYDEKGRPVPSPVVEKLIKDFAAKQGVEAREISQEEIFDRCILPMINEGAKILEEGIAIRSSDIDVVWVNGYGWPVHKGGPMWYADFLGTSEVLKRLKALEEKHGDAFKPASLLEKLAAEDKKFADYKTA